ncbi:MAG TPA: class II fumarate hydratase [Patescibacteria group bacterium]|nr:class II fumarate hydratase [Patescibacteria group bacterium]
MTRRRPAGGGVRIERDSLGPVRVPNDALYGAQTQRAVDNFPISGLRMPRSFLRALGLIKAAAARVNRGLGTLDSARARAIETAAREVADGGLDAHFPVDVFQTGSGTSTNMNANEVIARRAAGRLRRRVHPNDHVNLGQSSNDVIPSALHVAAALEIRSALLPALDHLAAVIDRRARALDGIVKTGRTHLMDAMPVRLGQEMSGWGGQVRDAAARLRGSLPRLQALALGGTAVGTGVNTHPRFARRVVAQLRRETGVPFTLAGNRFAAMGSQDAAVETSGQLRAAAVALTKIANDLRLMNSGPAAGLAEIRLPALQPGSSIMPGKVNPVVPEAVAMACAQVLGHDLTIAIAGQSGSFELNVMLPVVAYDLLGSIAILAASARLLADKAIAGFEVNRDRIAAALDRNAVLATALTPLVGYDRGAAIVHRAVEEDRPILDVAREMTGLDARTLARLLDPARLTGPARLTRPARRTRPVPRTGAATRTGRGRRTRP